MTIEFKTAGGCPLLPPTREPWLHIYPDASNGYAVDLNANTYAILTAGQAAAVREAGSVNASIKFPLRGRVREDATISGRALASAIDYQRANFDYDTDAGRKRYIINELVAIVMLKGWKHEMTIKDFWLELDKKPEREPGKPAPKSGWEAVEEIRKALEHKSLDFLEKKVAERAKKSLDRNSKFGYNLLAARQTNQKNNKQ